MESWTMKPENLRRRKIQMAEKRPASKAQISTGTANEGPPKASPELESVELEAMAMSVLMLVGFQISEWFPFFLQTAYFALFLYLP